MRHCATVRSRTRYSSRPRQTMLYRCWSDTRMLGDMLSTHHVSAGVTLAVEHLHTAELVEQRLTARCAGVSLAQGV